MSESDKKYPTVSAFKQVVRTYNMAKITKIQDPHDQRPNVQDDRMELAPGTPTRL